MTMIVGLILLFIVAPLAIGVGAAMLIERFRLLGLLPIGLFCFFVPSMAMLYAGVPLIVGMGAGALLAMKRRARSAY